MSDTYVNVVVMRYPAMPMEKFADEAFADQVGKRFEAGTLTAVEVVDEGAAVLMTFEVVTLR